MEILFLNRSNIATINGSKTIKIPIPKGIQICDPHLAPNSSTGSKYRKTKPIMVVKNKTFIESDIDFNNIRLKF